MVNKNRMYAALVLIILGVVLTILALKMSSSFDTGGQESFIFLFYLLLILGSGLCTWWLCVVLVRILTKKKM